MSSSLKYVVIPAAGIGMRMNLDTPKQYIELKNKKTILDTTISIFVNSDFFDKVIISLNKDDQFWQNSIYCNNSKVTTCIGGDTRFESVFNALESLNGIVSSDKDWIFVHDAARPAIGIDDIKSLYEQVISSKDKCGMLAVKVFETVKQVSNNYVESTLDRNYIWLAQTPQLSAFNVLKQSFKFCVDNNLVDKMTDEASALEFFGLTPIVVEGSKKNIKITTKEDLEFIDFLLNQ